MSLVKLAAESLLVTPSTPPKWSRHPLAAPLTYLARILLRVARTQLSWVRCLASLSSCAESDLSASSSLKSSSLASFNSFSSWSLGASGGGGDDNAADGLSEDGGDDSKPTAGSLGDAESMLELTNLNTRER